ncbi:MAG: ABC transporter ATP-binding protein [Prosthecobacter sp.]|uniref:ABC transporter ATP-binding protein n=1 Tax=Prosthecobacter sp. TaxID=1965333 RepID=UPI0038FEC6B5
MIEIENLTMNYGDLRALDGLNLTIQPGELFAFLGPNGAGKTTAMKLLTGLMKPDAGRVRLCGHDIQQEPLLAKALLGYVPDVAVFYEKLMPVEFMEFIAELFEMDRAHAASQTNELFTKFALHDCTRQRIENLSHGTRQRLAIASALLHDPKVFVIDEPMVGLDPIHARTVKREIKERSQRGTTVLMSTHLLNIAEELADRIGIIHHGKLIALGTLAELRAQHEQRGQRLEDIFLSMVEE